MSSLTSYNLVTNHQTPKLIVKGKEGLRDFVEWKADSQPPELLKIEEEEEERMGGSW